MLCYILFIYLLYACRTMKACRSGYAKTIPDVAFEILSSPLSVTVLGTPFGLNAP